jgi:hypothetical protein
MAPIAVIQKLTTRNYTVEILIKDTFNGKQDVGIGVN